MSPKRLTDAQTRKLVKNAIAAAEVSATNDQDFVRMLRASYFTQHPAIEEGLRAAIDRDNEVDPEQSIYSDPRFVKNVRKLAKKKDNLRIIGGEDVKPSEFPDCVAVGNDDEWCCTGTLIAPTVVLSAGHCDGCATRVFFGNDVNKKGTTIRGRAVQHPQYHKADHNDLLILILEKPAKVKPRKIAPASAINAATNGRAVGFGHVNVGGSYGYGTKRQVDVPIGSASCSGKVNGKTDSNAYGCDVNLEIVAGKSILTRDSCRGDSGGPFYIRSGANWLLAGATSRATKGAVRTCGDGGIYVRVDKYRSWIEQTANVKLP
jgi:secreted trypsin-like serine protease